MSTKSKIMNSINFGVQKSNESILVIKDTCTNRKAQLIVAPS